MSSPRKIGVLVPARAVAAVDRALQGDGNNNNNNNNKKNDNVEWCTFPITRENTIEDVTISVTSSPFDGFVNLCNGGRDDLVSAVEVVEALETLCVPYYSGAGPHTVKFNRSDVAALAFYAMEDNDTGCIAPCHGTIKRQVSSPSSVAAAAAAATSAPSMVDRLKFPVSVRPNKFQRTGASTAVLIANNMEERLAAQQRLFEQGNAAVFVQEEDTTPPMIADVFVLCVGHWKQDTKRSAVAVRIGTEPIDQYFASGNDKEKEQVLEQVSAISEKLFRGIFDDASLASPLRGHCLFRMQGRRSESNNNKKDDDEEKETTTTTSCWTWRVDDMEPNCSLITPECGAGNNNNNNAAQEECRAFRHVLKPLLLPSATTPLHLPDFLLSLVGFDAPPRYVAPTFRVEYDPAHRWYGLTAARDLKKDEIVFFDEATSFTLVTKPFVDANWSDDMKVVFSRYAWPVSGPEPVKNHSEEQHQHVYAIWSDEPSKWRPINHSCDPNVVFSAPHSLNCVAARDIPAGEVLTLDYCTFCDYIMKPFQCRCGASSCRGMIEPTEEALAKYGTNAWHRSLPKRC